MARADVTSWIYDGEVDSAAMLIAYQHWLLERASESRPTAWQCRIYVLLHQGHPGLLMEHSPVPLVRCGSEAGSCTHCNKGNGTWEFRWCNQAWYHTYEMFAQPGTWRRPNRACINGSEPLSTGPPAPTVS